MRFSTTLGSAIAGFYCISKPTIDTLQPTGDEGERSGDHEGPLGIDGVAFILAGVGRRRHRLIHRGDQRRHDPAQPTATRRQTHAQTAHHLHRRQGKRDDDPGEGGEDGEGGGRWGG